jgi:hypothetical protein
MRDIIPGETWAIVIDGENHKVEIIGARATPGWWTCRDHETGIEFAAREHWFLTRLETDDS